MGEIRHMVPYEMWRCCQSLSATVSRGTLTLAILIPIIQASMEDLFSAQRYRMYFEVFF